MPPGAKGFNLDFNSRHSFAGEPHVTIFGPDKGRGAPTVSFNDVSPGSGYANNTHYWKPGGERGPGTGGLFGS